ncbi:MAG: RidA family protein [Acidimicrobiales bacterium]
MHDLTNPGDVPAPPGGWYSHAAGVPMGSRTLVFVSGQIALADDGTVTSPGDMAGQAERVFELLERILADRGATFDNVVNIRTYVTDMAQLPDYGRVRARYITGRPPTSTTVQVVRLFRPEAVVEVEVVAAIGQPAGQSNTQLR